MVHLVALWHLIFTLTSRQLTRMRNIAYLLAVVSAMAAHGARAQADECKPGYSCDQNNLCNPQLDTRNCEPGWSCSGLGKPFCELDKARYKAQCEAEKGAQNAGYAAAKLACETKKSAARAECETRRAMNCAVKPTVDAGVEGVNHFFKEVEKEFCNLMTAGGSKRGDAGCGVNAGVGRDRDGPYSYDPQRPDEKYRPNQGGSKGQSSEHAKDLQRLADSLARTTPTYVEYDFQDAFGVDRFLPGKDRIGKPWPEAAGRLASPTRSGLIRDRDKAGGGGFLSLRSDSKSGSVRFHAGEDYVAVPNERIFSPIIGTIERMKNPGKRGLTGLLIRADSGHTLSIYYVAPTQAIQKTLSIAPEKRSVADIASLKVQAGESVLGYAQDLTLPHRYGPGITNHVHVTLQDSDGKFISLSDSKVVIKPHEATPKK